MRSLVGVVLVALVAARAAAQPVDAAAPSADAGAPTAAAPAAPPTESLSPLAPTPGGPGWSEPLAPPPEPIPSPLRLVEPAAPPESSPDGPGDEEAKADFQETRETPDGSPLRWRGRAGVAALYGFGQLDYLNDSTQGLGVHASNATLARQGTAFGDDGQSAITACGSRLGARLSTSEAHPVRGTFLTEVGPSLDGGDPCHGNRVRHLYLAMRSPIVDVLVGKYYALAGWGGKGFLPNTAAFIAPPGQLYRLESQLRVSHIFRWSPLDLELAGAFGASPQQDPPAAEPQLGLRAAFNGWRGASAQGVGPPVAAPFQIGLSWARRVFQVNDFAATPSAQQLTSNHLWALDVFAPIIPANGDDLSNSASLTLEMTFGSGFADWYPGLTGGVLYPALPNPKNVLPSPVYIANFPPGIVTFDANGGLRTIEWHTLVVGAQYHLPFHRGRRVWVSGLYSRTRSDNAKVLTPFAGWGGVWDDARYVDLNVFVAATPALQLALSSQLTEQTFGDGAVARNSRTQLSAGYFF